MASRQPRIIVVGPVSPPITGAVTVTRDMVKEFRAHDENILVFDIARRRKGVHHIRKIVKYLTAALTIPFLALRYRVTLYMSVNAKSGIPLNILLLWLSRPFCARVILHHHVFGYVATHNALMARLCAIAPKKVLHVTQCDRMNQGLHRHYGQSLSCVSISNAFWLSAADDDTRVGAAGRPLVLGHLSNLCRAKGTHEAISVVRELRAQGYDIRLELAGPFASEETRTFVEAAVHADGAWLAYRGPLYGDDKAAFFKSIDAFLFPSESETEGIVTLEALSYGRPVIAYEVGCLPDRIPAEVGCLSRRERPLVEACLGFIDKIYQDRAALNGIAGHARERVRMLREDSAKAMQKVIEFALG